MNIWINSFWGLRCDLDLFTWNSVNSLKWFKNINQLVMLGVQIKML